MILAISTSTDRGSLALTKAGKVISQSAWSRHTHSGETLTAKLNGMMKKAKVPFEALTVIALDKGPGSFTGCRISAAVAKTLAYTYSLPISAWASLDIMTEAAKKHDGRIISLLDAHKSLLYGRWYDCHDQKIVAQSSEIHAVSVDEVVSWCTPGTLVIGDVKGEVRASLSHKRAVFLKSLIMNAPQAKVLAQVAFERDPADQNSRSKDWFYLEPSYIRSPDAVEKLKAR